MNVHVAINNSRAVSGKVPEPTDDEESKRAVDKIWRDFNGRFENRQVSVDEFMRLVTSGYAFTAQHNHYRHSKNFIQAQHLALDMDHVGMSLEQVSQVPFFKRFASFAYTTPSHREDNPRLRVVFILDRPIKDKQKYAELAAALVGRFGMADQSVKDPARFFYGSLGALYHWYGNVMTLDDAANELVFPDRRIREQAKQAALYAAANRVVIPAGNVSSRLLQIHSEKLLSRVRMAQDGEKYFTLRNTAIAFGGYIANNYYRRDDVQMWLEAAIAANGNNVRSMEAAIKCIEKGIDYGAERPLHFEVNQTPSGDYPELERVHPPLTPQQKEAVARIIADKEWKAYHDGMTVGERALWRGKGMDDVVIDMLNLGVKHDIDEETGEISDVMTLPYLRGGEIVNVEYRGREVSYASDAPSLYFPEESQKSSPVLVMADSLDAIKMWLNYGHCYRIAGLPQLTVNQTMFEGDEYVIGICPGMDIAGTGLMKLEGKVKFTQFPVNVGKLIEYGMTPEQLGQYIRYASKILA